MIPEPIDDAALESLVDTLAILGMVKRDGITSKDWDRIEKAAGDLEFLAREYRAAARRAERQLCPVCGDDLGCKWRYPDYEQYQGVRLRRHPHAGEPLPHIHGWCAMCREARRQGVM